MNPIIWTVILSILPISELRGALIYAISIAKINPWLAFFVAVLANIAIIPFIFLFLDYVNKGLLHIKWYKRFFDFYVTGKIKKVKKKYEKVSLFVLFIFVAIPSPGTGAYTGSLIAWFFKLNRRQSFAVIALGVVTAGIMTALIVTGGLNILNFLV